MIRDLKSDWLLIILAILVAVGLVFDRYFLLVGKKDLIYYFTGQRIVRKDFRFYESLVEAIEINWKNRKYRFEKIHGSWVPKGEYIGNILKVNELDKFLNNFLFRAKFTRLLNKDGGSDYGIGDKGYIKIEWKNKKKNVVLLVGNKALTGNVYYCKIGNAVGVLPYFYIRWVDLMTSTGKRRKNNDRRGSKRDIGVSKQAEAAPR